MLCKLNLIGNVGQNAQIKFTPQGKGVCEFSLAINEKAKSGNNAETKENTTTWFRISIFHQQPKDIAQYFSKGRLVYLEGHLKIREYIARDGSTKTSLEVTATEYRFLSSGNNLHTSKATSNTNNATVDPYVDTDVDVEDPFFAG